MFSSAALFALTGLLSTVSAHGQITTPTPRSAGTAMESACGQQVYNNQASDSYGNIQGELQVAATQSDYNAAECDIWLCKGYKYDDNTANVQSYTAGQVIPITVDIRAPHTGTCNVSIVDTATNTMISDELIYFDVYASTSTTIPANNTQFSITMPTDLGSKCDTAGACVIQWYWNAESVDQTYESCIDFTLGGSGSSNTTIAATSSAAVSLSSSVVSSSATSVLAVSSSVAAASSSVAVAEDAATVTSIVTGFPSVATTSCASSSTSAKAATSILSNLAGNAVTSSSISATAAAPTTLQTSVLSVPTTISSTLVNTITPSTTSTASAAAATVDPMPAGTTWADLLSWLNTYVTNLIGSSN